MPQWTPTQRELDDLDLLTLGLFTDGATDLTGFTRPEGDHGVPGLALFVPPEVADPAQEAGTLDLLDPEGVPLARLTVQETYPDRGQPA